MWIAAVVLGVTVGGVGAPAAAKPVAQPVAKPVAQLANPSAVQRAGQADQAPPSEFGTDWDDPRTAAPPVTRPAGRSCTTTIVDTKFVDFTPYTGIFTPPAACRGPWRKVVLRMDGAVAGRQFDRLGALHIGGVTVFKTSTPEPSPQGIRWSVEKDLTGYAALLATTQPVDMLIGNVVDDTYTGVLDVQVSLTFYPGRPPAGVATDVLALAGAHPEGTALVGDVAVPRNTERLVADVYATGSGGGCEEFYYLVTPAGTPYSCAAGDGPYRELQVRLDGKLAGIAAPYPHIYTGGWSNPFLWYVLPAPHAFDIRPLRVDLTPFVGQLTDGRPHRVQVSVLGVPPEQSGWDVPTTLLAWRDPGRAQVSGAVTAVREQTPVDDNDFQDGATRRLVTTAGHGLTVAGFVDTSHGRVRTTVRRNLGASATHSWNADETVDGLTATWTDASTVTVRGGARPTTTTTTLRYAIDGQIAVTPEDRLTTTIRLTDAASTTGVPGGPTRLSDTFAGTAAWTLNVPREQRHATADSAERYRLSGPGTRVDRRVATRNGSVLTGRRESP